MRVTLQLLAVAAVTTFIAGNLAEAYFLRPWKAGAAWTLLFIVCIAPFGLFGQAALVLRGSSDEEFERKLWLLAIPWCLLSLLAGLWYVSAHYERL